MTVDTVASGLTTEMYISATILIASYVLIFSEIIHRTTSAMLGAVVMVGVARNRRCSPSTPTPSCC